MKTLLTCLVLLFASTAQAGLFFGPNTRVTNHYYAPAVAVPTAVYSVSPVWVASPKPARVHPHKAAKHSAKAAYHQTLADFYQGK